MRVFEELQEFIGYKEREKGSAYSPFYIWGNLPQMVYGDGVISFDYDDSSSKVNITLGDSVIAVNSCEFAEMIKKVLRMKKESI